MCNGSYCESGGGAARTVWVLVSTLSIMLLISSVGLAAGPLGIDITTPSSPRYVEPGAELDVTFTYTSHPSAGGTTKAVIELLKSDGNLAVSRSAEDLPEGAAVSFSTAITAPTRAGVYDLRVTITNSDGSAAAASELIGVNGSGPDIPILGALPSYVGPYDEEVDVVGVAGPDTSVVRVYRERRLIGSAPVVDGRFVVPVRLVMRGNELCLRGADSDGGKLSPESKAHTIYRKLVGERIARQTTGPVGVFFNGERIDFDVDPYIANDRTLVPVRHVSEAMGFDVTWREDTRRVFIIGEKRIVLTVGEQTAEVNGQATELDVAPAIKDDRVMVPLRFVSEALEGHVQWDEGLWSVFITR